MALSLIATPGDANANAFADLAQANALIAYQPEAISEEWSDLDADQQTRALVSATRDINAINWDELALGGKTFTDQALNWPRNGSATLPTLLVQATILEALSRRALFADGASAADATAGLAADVKHIKSETIGPIKTDYVTPQDGDAALLPFSPDVQRLLRGLFVLPVDPDLYVGLYGTGTAIRSS